MGLIKLSDITTGNQQYNQAQRMRDYYTTTRQQNPHLSAEAAWHRVSNTATNRRRNGMTDNDMNTFYNRYVAGDPNQGAYNPNNGWSPAEYEKWAHNNPVKSAAMSLGTGFMNGLTFGTVGSKQLTGYDDTTPTYDTMTNRVNASTSALGSAVGGTIAMATALTGFNRLRRGKVLKKLLRKTVRDNGVAMNRAARLKRVQAAKRIQNRYGNMNFLQEAALTSKRWLVDPVKDAYRTFRHPIQRLKGAYNRTQGGTFKKSMGVAKKMGGMALAPIFLSEYIDPVTNLATGSLVNNANQPLPQDQQQLQ